MNYVLKESIAIWFLYQILARRTKKNVPEYLSEGQQYRPGGELDALLEAR